MTKRLLMKSALVLVVTLCIVIAATGTGLMNGSVANAASGRTFPDTTSKIGVFADQVTAGMGSFTSQQLNFLATKFVGSQKLSKSFSDQIRAITPNFLVLHYHLGDWQSASNVPFIIDGQNWGNDYNTVTTHEDWFMHSETDPSKRVEAFDDHKLLMRLNNPDFYTYWKNSLIQQANAGDYDGIFLDSMSTSCIQYYVGAAFPEYSSTNVITHLYPELGNITYQSALQTMMQNLTTDLTAVGIKTLPNVDALNTGWDNTDYSVNSGVFAEGALSWQKNYGQADWKMGMNNLLKLIGLDKIVICQTYLSSGTDYQWRLYNLANYLLLKGKYTYISYFASKPFEYYPEYDINLGSPTNSATSNSIDTLKSGNFYIRNFTYGKVIVNSSDNTAYTYTIPSGSWKKASVTGGGTIDANGAINGSISYTAVSGRIKVAAKSALIIVNNK
jgi:hypothetical protein